MGFDWYRTVLGLLGSSGRVKDSNRTFGGVVGRGRDGRSLLQVGGVGGQRGGVSLIGWD